MWTKRGPRPGSFQAPSSSSEDRQMGWRCAQLEGWRAPASDPLGSPSLTRSTLALG